MEGKTRLSSDKVPLAVVMSVYNNADCVGRSIESIVNQTFEDWQFVIVDDCSTDSTPNVLQEYAEKNERILIVRQEKNQGLARSLNLGIASCSSPIIARMDGDDESLPDRLRLQYDFMQEHPDVDVLGTGAYFVPPGSPGSPFPVLMPETHAELAANIYRRVPFIHPTVVFRREYIERAGGYSTVFRRGQDAELWMRTYRWASFHNLQEPLLMYSWRQSLRFRDVTYTMRRYYGAAKRDGELIRRGRYVLRPLLSYLLSKFGWRPAFVREARSVSDSTQ